MAKHRATSRPCFPDVSQQVEKQHAVDVLTQIRTEKRQFSVRIGEKSKTVLK